MHGWTCRALQTQRKKTLFPLWLCVLLGNRPSFHFSEGLSVLQLNLQLKTTWFDLSNNGICCFLLRRADLLTSLTAMGWYFFFFSCIFPSRATANVYFSSCMYCMTLGCVGLIWYTNLQAVFQWQCCLKQQNVTLTLWHFPSFDFFDGALSR